MVEKYSITFYNNTVRHNMQPGSDMAITQDQTLRTVRAFLSGSDAQGKKVTRRNLAGLSVHELVYVAVAIMLCRPRDYLDSTLCVQGYLSENLDKIVLTGVSYPHTAWWPTRDSLVHRCRKAGLYRSEGKSSTVRLTLTPPEELTALVVEFSDHPAVTAFCQEMQEAWELAGMTGKEARRRKKPPLTTAVTGNYGTVTEKAMRVAEWLKGLEPDVYEAVREQLRNE